MNRELKILKWVAIALAALSTVFTLVIVGSHLSGRLVGLGKIGIVGSVGAEFMAIICAWLSASDRKIVAGVAMLCAMILTAVLLVNASVALDLDWQETQAAKAEQSRLEREKLAAEERRKTIAATAALAQGLAVTDKRLAREFVKTNTAEKPQPPALSDSTAEAEPKIINVAKLSVYERYGLTTVPLFLALLTVVALGLAAHSDSSYSPVRSESEFSEFLESSERGTRPQSRFDAGRRSYTSAPKTATHRTSVATDGLAVLRQALRDLAFERPGYWFKTDKRADHILIRLNNRIEGREQTSASCKLTLTVLTDAEQMPFTEFRERLKKLLIKKSVL